MNKYLVLLQLIILTMLLSFTYSQGTYYVQTILPPGCNSPGSGTQSCPWDNIQLALNSVPPGSIIYVINDGVYFENIDWPQVDNIQLIGQPDLLGNLPTIDGSSNTDRVIYMTSTLVNQITNATVISNFNIINGSLSQGNGGGILMEGWVAPTLDNLTFYNNFAYSAGGAIAYYPTSLYYYDQVNHCDNWNCMQPCVISNCHIHDNQAASGGGFVVEQSRQYANPTCPPFNIETPCLTIYSTEIFDNIVNLVGGGACIDRSYVVIEKSIIRHNTAAAHGGGLYISQAKTRFSKNLILTNHASFSGGGVFLVDGIIDDIHCSDCNNGFYDKREHVWEEIDVIDNRANSYGGGIFISSSIVNTSLEQYLDLYYCSGTISDNWSDVDGGGIYVEQHARMI
ncbi:MAG: hypothetical protein NTU44_16640 [Bacteroidetes bacterium]|nr:hypothetical protein [Bacteroidota bacterium]